MKHLKTFENYNRSDFYLEIAEDLYPRLIEEKNKRKFFSYDDYVKYMKDKKANDEMIDSVFHELVNLGFDFDSDVED